MYRNGLLGPFDIVLADYTFVILGVALLGAITSDLSFDFPRLIAATLAAFFFFFEGLLAEPLILLGVTSVFAFEPFRLLRR